MSHTFVIELKNSDIEQLLLKVKTNITKSGGTFNGDVASGSFSGSGVHGTYFIVNKCITITISKKPFIVTNKLVESKIRGYFS